ncbi:hypothetical protein OPT61_g4635 [Boeremia exigua]|uniref:Uncharacterized protein n=1 Tax=Boeremia exigua TaxID=749465 RepID=A0ACC2IDC7_9PLEO|nr:hypothetical protein OPT61_g4635 [Boeremia exigua]
MPSLTATLFFAALASAQASNYTTTAWMTNYAGSDKFGYVASVIDADAEHMTLAMSVDADTDVDTLNIFGFAGNFTFGPSGYTMKEIVTRYPRPPETTDIEFAITCSQPAQSEESATCTFSQGDGYARIFRCNEDQTTRSVQRLDNFTTSFPHTYGTGLWGAAGTETVTRTMNFPPQSVFTTPAWCTSDSVPESVKTLTLSSPASNYAVYQIVIFAGQEKLSAFSGSSVVVSTASGSTGSVPEATASAGSSGDAAPSATGTASPESTGAAGKINAVVPAVVGMGVAAVVGML